MMEEADLLFKKINTSLSLLDKLRKDLIDAKLKYASNQIDLANVAASNGGRERQREAEEAEGDKRT